MFKENKYSVWYNDIISKAKQRSILRSYFEGEYHHIVPKSLGGTDDIRNLVKLTYREHYICHLLLTKMCEEKQHEIKMCWALHRLVFAKTNFSSYDYDLARRIHVKNLTENHPSKSPEWRERVSKRVLKDWENNEERKESMKLRMAKWREDNPEKALLISRENGKHGMSGKDNPISIEIDYKGKKYYGWRELKEKTGVSKHLYKKYYMNNLPLLHRIGANGPVPSK